MPSSYSSLAPQTRQKLEDVMFRILSSDQLTVREIRLKIRRGKLVRGNLPINEQRLVHICHGLKRKGLVKVVGEKNSTAIWTAVI